MTTAATVPTAQTPHPPATVPTAATTLSGPTPSDDSTQPLRAVPAAGRATRGTRSGRGSTAAAEAPTEGDGSQASPGQAARPVLQVTSDPHAIRLLKAALGQGVIPDVYVTDGAPVKIERVSGTLAVDLDADVPLPVTSSLLRPDLLGSLLAHHANVQQLTARGAWAEWAPPAQVLRAVLAGAEWPGLAPLIGIVGTPVLRRDWTLTQTPGYDPGSGLFLSPTVDLAPVPERPTPQQVQAARRFLLATLLGDFEWEDAASLANYVGLLVTQFLRRPLKCLVPFGIVTATMPGSGKSLLTGLIGLLVGQKIVPWPADNDTELRKLITSSFTVEAGAVIFDNLAEGEIIASPILANLLTNAVWSDRLLGGNQMPTFPNDRLWMATGNNLRVGGDIASRAVYVRLAPKNPHPEQRSGFAIPDLELWLKDPAHRAQLLWRLLVLVADWVAAGTPKDTTVPSMRQFTPWAHGIGGFLAHHGIRGFLTNLDIVRGMDEEDRKWAVFLATWRQRLGTQPVRPSDVMANAAITRDPLTGRDIDPWDGDFITDKLGRRPGNPIKLGLLLSGHADRFHGDPPLVLRAVTDAHNKSTRYWVEEHRP